MSTSADNYISTSKGESSREGTVIHPTNLKRDPKSFQTDIPITADCLFCAKDAKKRSKEQFSSLVVKALYSKYSSSQNYYYTKDINEMLAEMKSSAVILFKDYIHFDEEEEYLKRYYQIHEYDFKIKMLTEYYKFHNEIARIFMHPITHVVNRFHDKKRRLEYIRVTNMLKVEQGQPELQEPEEEKKEHQDYIITDRILDDLQFTEQDSKEVKSNPYILHNEQLYFSRKLTGHEPNDLSSKVSTAKNQQVIKNADAKKNPQKNINTQSKDVSVSSTLHDINAKLGEIISNSRSYNPESYYLENNESLPNETITNLDSFLVFLKKNPQDYKALEIQKLIPKKQASKNVVSSSTADKMNRQESARIAPKLKQTPKGETALKISDSHVKNVSPMVKAPVKILKSHERSKETSEERSINPSTGNKHQDLDVRPSRPKSGTATVTKIKNFEEAIKINTQDYQQKMTIHTSLPRESQVLPSTPKNRTSSSRTPNKQGKEKSYGSKTRPQTSAANSTKSTMRSKTKSTDIYTKTLDLLLGSNQILLNSQVQKKEIVTQNNLKNSFNFKSKTPNQIHMHHQDKSLGRDDGRGDSALSSSNIKIMSNKVSADRISLQTDRGSKKSGMFGLDLHKKDVRQAPLSDRQLSKDSIHRSKEFSGKSNKKSLKVSIMTQSESENMKPEFAPYADFNKLGLHKYTKSESRTKKSAEKERKDSATKASSIASNKKLKVGSSPKKHGSPSKHSNNMAGVFPSSSTGKRSERSSGLKGDRQPEQDGMSHRNDGSSRNVKSRPSRSELFTQFHQSLIKQLNGVNLNNDYRNLDLSPLRMNQKDNIVTRQTPILSDRSPINFNTGYQYQTPNKKELDLIQKGLNLENFENLVNQRKNRKVNNFFK